MSPVEIIGFLVMVVGAAASVIYWHTNSLKKVEEKFESKIESLSQKHQELKDEMKDLQHRDDLQQMSIDGIKELWPLINDKVKKLEQ